MKPTSKNPLLAAASIALISTISIAQATDLYWDADGDTTAATGGPGTWQTSNTWRSGSDVGSLGNWVDGTSPFNTAVFGGAISNSPPAYTVTLANSVNVNLNQLKIIASGTNGTFTLVGPTTAPNTSTIAFGGSYSSATPTIDASTLNSAVSVTINAKMTGTIASGGLYIKANNPLFDGYNTNSGLASRIYLTASTANDFTGDITIDGGSLLSLSNMGNAANKITLTNGGGLFGNSGTTVNYEIARDIIVSASGGAIGSNSSAALAVVTTKLARNKSISGSGNLSRYQSTANVGTEEVWLFGDMSGYTGTFENFRGITQLRTTSPSGGVWKLTGGTLKLFDTDNAYIADGPGKSDLFMNGGTLDMNGKSETINGLSGATGTVQNQVAATTSTLTLGGGDATATFGGVIRDNTTSGGKMALAKTGNGTQTLAGTNTYTGDTTVNAGTLTLASTGNLRFAPTTNGVSNKLTGSGTANLNGTLDLDLSNANLTVGNSWTLVDAATANYALVAITSTPALTFTKAGPLWTAPDGANTWTFSQSTGVLTLASASAFTSWVTTPAFGLAPADQDPTDDPDNDGLNNLLEFVLNGNPSVSNAAIQPVLAVTATAFEFTFSRRDDSLSPETTQTFQYGTNLGTWTSILVPAASGTAGAATITVTNGSPADTVKISIPKTEAGATGKLFGRLQVTQP